MNLLFSSLRFFYLKILNSYLISGLLKASNFGDGSFFLVNRLKACWNLAVDDLILLSMIHCMSTCDIYFILSGFLFSKSRSSKSSSKSLLFCSYSFLRYMCMKGLNPSEARSRARFLSPSCLASKIKLQILDALIWFFILLYT